MMVSDDAPGPMMFTAVVSTVPAVSVMSEIDASKLMVSPSIAASAASRSVQLPAVRSVQFAAVATPSPLLSTVIVVDAPAEPANAVSNAAALPVTRSAPAPTAPPRRACERRDARLGVGVVIGLDIGPPWACREDSGSAPCGDERSAVNYLHFTLKMSRTTKKARPSGRAFVLLEAAPRVELGYGPLQGPA